MSDDLEPKTGIDLRYGAGEVMNHTASTIFNDQFDRENNLQQELYDSDNADKFDMFGEFFTNIWILGLGGIGGHVAEMVSSIREVSKLVLFDDDVVDVSNLNRTIYKYHHVDSPKVLAASEIVSGRNMNINVIPIVQRFDEQFSDQVIHNDTFNLFDIDYYTTILVVDCRDDFYNDYGLFDEISKHKYGTKFVIVRAAYDGMSITLDINPKENFVWTKTASGYENAPSHSIPSRLAALLILTYTALYNHWDVNENKSKFKGPYTFNLLELFKFIDIGVRKKNKKLMKQEKENEEQESKKPIDEEIKDETTSQ